jgi:hypothetical protein
MVIFNTFCLTLFNNALRLFIEPKHLALDNNIESAVFDCNTLYTGEAAYYDHFGTRAFW